MTHVPGTGLCRGRLPAPVLRPRKPLVLVCTSGFALEMRKEAIAEWCLALFLLYRLGRIIDGIFGVAKHAFALTFGFVDHALGLHAFIAGGIANALFGV